MSFPVNGENAAAREAIYKLFEAKERGEFVSHRDIERAGKLKKFREHNRYFYLMDRVRKQLRVNRGVTLVMDFGLGYRVATVGEQLDEIPRRSKRARRQLARGIADVKALPEMDATDAELRRRDVRLAYAARQRKDLNFTVGLEDYLLRRKPGEPLRVRRRPDDGLALG
jgi:hypothetical protein